MTLFFETARQAQRFLCMVPLGFALAMCLDASAWAGRLRAAVDCLLLLLCGWLVLCSVAAYHESALRAYHLLGLMIGAVLYLQGIGRMVRMLVRRIAARRQEKQRRV